MRAILRLLMGISFLEMKSVKYSHVDVIIVGVVLIA